LGQPLQIYSGTEKKTLWKMKDVMPIEGLWMSPDGTRVVAVHDGSKITVFDTTTGSVLYAGRAHNVGMVVVTFSGKGNRFFTSGADGRVVMWDVRTVKKLKEFRGNDQERMTAADLSPDGRRVVTVNTGGSWQLWDVETGVQLMNVACSSMGLFSVAFSGDGQRIFTTGDDNTVRMWQAVAADPTISIPLDATYLKGLNP
jgi:WD40 repeat protein